MESGRPFAVRVSLSRASRTVRPGSPSNASTTRQAGRRAPQPQIRRLRLHGHRALGGEGQRPTSFGFVVNRSSSPLDRRLWNGTGPRGEINSPWPTRAPSCRCARAPARTARSSAPRRARGRRAPGAIGSCPATCRSPCPPRRSSRAVQRVQLDEGRRPTPLGHPGADRA